MFYGGRLPLDTTGTYQRPGGAVSGFPQPGLAFASTLAQTSVLGEQNKISVYCRVARIRLSENYPLVDG